MKIVWLQGVTCNGNSHSFLNYEYFDPDLFLYHPLFETPLGIEELEEAKFDILVLEGGLHEKWKRFGKNFTKLFFSLAKKAKRVVCVGSCAVYGGIFKEYDQNISGFLFNKQQKSRWYEEFYEKCINIPGCPAHPEWIALGIFGKNLKLDEYNRPKELFAYTVHTGCIRNEYFEWKVDAKSLGLKEGCLFYEYGCQAPFTHGSCNKILWNETSSKTRVGTPCFGCTEADFPKQNLFFTKTYMGIPAVMPLGVPKRAYLTITGIAKSFKIARLHKRIIDED